MSGTNVTQHCEICNCLLSLPLIKKCGRCMDLSDSINILINRREKTRAALLAMLLTPSMVAAIGDIDVAYGYGEANEYDPSQEEGWGQLADIALNIHNWGR